MKPTIFAFALVLGLAMPVLADNPPPIPHPGAVTTPTFDEADIRQKLAGDGLEGMIHGAVHDQGIYVLTYRKAGQILGVEFSLIGSNAVVRDSLKQARRNDLVRVFGKLSVNNGQPHIFVNKLEVVKAWNPGAEPPVVRPNVDLPSEVLSHTEFIGKVHVAAAGGNVLVVDYRGIILPVVVENPALTKNLWPNDKIRLHYVVRTSPGRPSHLVLDEKAAKPVEVLESQEAQVGKEVTLTGTLVLFPKSVLTNMEVFAVQTTDADGVNQYHFIFSRDMQVLTDAYAKLRQHWNSDTQGRVTYRTRYVNANLKVEVKGTFFATNQAGNPQVLLDTADGVSLK